jgi:hypothetical protein
MKAMQAPSAVIMVRPASFGFNNQTAETNAFQSVALAPDLSNKVLVEFDTMVDKLQAHDIEVIVVNDTAQPPKPDAIFPNNWISFHADGTVALYPMLAENRRWERNNPILEIVRLNFNVSRVLDFTHYERSGKFFEGTGSMVCDYVNRIAYASRSARTHEDVFREVCQQLNFKPVLFDAIDEAGLSIYHTNVLMAIGSRVAVVCLDAIKSDADQELLLGSLAETNHQVVAISYAQMRAFAGNMIEVRSTTGSPYMLMSEQAFQSLLPGQANAIARYAELLPLSIATIEQLGGGSVRCMVTGVFNERLVN